MIGIRQCIICEQQFTPVRGAQKVCSKTCRKKHRAIWKKKWILSRRKTKSRNCVICNTLFNPRSSQKTCSSECSRKSALQQRRRWYKENRAKTKQCVICHKSFSAQRSQKTCSKECSRKLSKLCQERFWLRHPNHRTYYEKHYARRKRLEIIKLLGNKCQLCEYSTCPEILHIHHIHHINGRQKNHRYPYRYFKASDISEYKLLCPNCHAETHWKINKSVTEK